MFKKKNKNLQGAEKTAENGAPAGKQVELTSGFLSDKMVEWLIFGLAFSMGVIHIIYANHVIMSLETYKTMHLCFGLGIGVALLMKSAKRGIRIVHLIMLLAIAFSFIYIAVNVDALRLRAWMNTDLDIAVGLILIVMAYYTTFRHFGWVLPALAFIIMIYPMFGKYFTGVLQTTNYTLKQTIVNLSIGLQGGVYQVMAISANYIFLFSVLGGVMGAVGVQHLFAELGKLVAGRIRAGSAITTCVMQALFGTVVSSGIATAQLSAPYSLPEMEKAGYTKLQAAAILTASSNGGAILPPVMGVVAFGIAGYAGIPYWTVCKMGLIPALLYFACIIWYGHLQAMKNPMMRVKKMERPPVDWEIIKWKGMAFLAPFILIIVMLAKGQPITKVASYAMAVTIIFAYATKKEYRPKWRNIFKNFSSGAVAGAKIACCVACIGTLVTTFNNSGLSVKLASSIGDIAGGNLFIVILIIYLISIIAGMAGVAVAGYFVVAAFSVSILTNLGVGYEIAHFFSAYPSFFAVLTPPVAILSLVVAKLADQPYGKTALETCKVAFTGFIMPFVFCYAPAICLMYATGIWKWIDIGIVVLFAFGVQTVFCGWLLDHMNIAERVIMGGGCVLLFIFLMQRHMLMLYLGILLILAIIAMQIIKSRSQKRRTALA